MKRRLFILAISCCVSVAANGQTSLIKFIKKHEGAGITIVCINNAHEDYEVTVEIEYTGMELSESIPVISTVAGRSQKDLITLTPIPGQSWNYKSKYSYIPVREKAEETDVADVPIIHQSTVEYANAPEDSKKARTSEEPRAVKEPVANETPIVTREPEIAEVPVAVDEPVDMTDQIPPVSKSTHSQVKSRDTSSSRGSGIPSSAADFEKLQVILAPDFNAKTDSTRKSRQPK